MAIFTHFRNLTQTIVLTLLTILILSCWSELSAAPIILTSGTISVPPSSSLSRGVVDGIIFRFAGDEIVGSGGNGGQGPFGSISQSCPINCITGNIVSPVAILTTGTPAFSGRVTYRGNLYEVMQASFSFTGESEMLSDVFSPSGVQRVTLPFEMTGTLSLRSLDPSIPDITIDVIGSGLVNMIYVEERVQPGLTDPGTSSLVRVEYILDAPTPEPTPEPATILMLGAGIAGIGGYISRRRKVSKV